MTEIIIRHDGKTSNLDCLEAVQKFMTLNYTQRKSCGYRSEMEITTSRNCGVKISEAEHPDNNSSENYSPCSVIFNIETVKFKRGKEK